MQSRGLGSFTDDGRRVASAFSIASVLLVAFALAAGGGIAQALPAQSSQSSGIAELETDLSTPLTHLPSYPVGPFDAYISANGAWPLDLYSQSTSIEAREVPFSEHLASSSTRTSFSTDYSPLGTISLTGVKAHGYEGETLHFVLQMSGDFGGTIHGLILTSGKGEDFTDGEEPTATRDIDYFHTRRTVSSDGPEVLDIYVPTYEDGVVEPDEWFLMMFFCNDCNPYFRTQLRGWILDDSAPTAGLSVGDATVTEGDAGTTMATFTVNLAPASASTVTVGYSTCGVGCDPAATATGGDDYVIAVDSLTFAPGETSKTIPVTINGDTVVEPDEVFFMGLGGATGATITDNQGRGTIVDDDGGTSNVAPVVSAGPNQTVTLPNSAALNGTVTDDGLPSGSLTSTWTKQSGPGTATFGDTHAIDTTASFSTNGTYVLRLSATDGALTTSDDVTITVNPTPPPPDFFVDDDDSVFGADITWMAAAGITKGCNPPINDRFCPDANVTRGQMAAFLVRSLNLTERLHNPFTDDDGSIFEADIERLAAAGITKGCNPPTNDRFCPDAKVTRGQMAAFLVRALGYTNNGGGNLFDDDNGSVFEADIDRLGTAGVTKGCNPPTNNRYCPNTNVTRGQMAAFLHRALE